MSPRVSSCSSSCLPRRSAPRRMLAEDPARCRRRITRLRAAIRYRNVPETSVPIQPGHLVQRRAVVRDLAAERPDAEREQEREHEDDRRVPEREEEADAQRPLALGHQLARRVVDRRDVVGVEGVAQPERVGGDADADGERARRCRAGSGAARRARSAGQKPSDVQPAARRRAISAERPPLAGVERAQRARAAARGGVARSPPRADRPSKLRSRPSPFTRCAPPRCGDSTIPTTPRSLLQTSRS